MDDSQIVALYWARQETAVSETKKKYGRYLFSIANHILSQNEDSEECVNDTLLGALELHSTTQTGCPFYLPWENHTASGTEEASDERCGKTGWNGGGPVSGGTGRLHSHRADSGCADERSGTGSGFEPVSG